MICPTCSTKNFDYHLYCYLCGTSLTMGSAENSVHSKEDRLSASGDEAFTTEEKTPGNRMDVADENIIYDKQSSLDDKTKKTENKIESVSASWTDTTEDDWWNLDYSDDGLLQDNYREEEFNYQEQLPLRRYRKAAREKDEDGLQLLIKTFISIVLIALIAVLVYIGYDQLKQKQSYQPETKLIDVDYKVEETEQNGMPARKIIIQSSNGEQVKLLDKTAAVSKDLAEFVLLDRELALTGNYEEKDGKLQVVLILTMLADGYPDLNEEIHFEVPVHKAPLHIISPSSGEAVIDGNNTQLILKVLPGSDVLINDNHYSHLLDDQGNLSVQLEVPDQAETLIQIQVSARGYHDNLGTVLLKRRQMEFPLVIDQNIPIQAQDTEWVEITGNTHPEAVLSTNLTLQGEPVIDAVTGDFKLFVRAASKGYTPLVLTAKLEGKEDSLLETVIERPSGERDYTGAAWASDYQELIRYPNLHHGVSFKYSGRIKDIQSTGTKTTLLVDMATQGQAERIIHVEYWKTGSFVLDERIDIFGNYWGSKDDNPYVLAYYIYR